jgi:rubrerythrin
MKKQLIFVLISACAFMLIMSSCSSPKPVKTLDNLKAAITGESTASAKYAAFAAKAREEGFDTIAKMFDATSKAESIHAANHLAVLNKLGTEFTVQLEKFDVLTTKENILGAINGESYEFSTMYPGFISTAKEEKADGAVTSFNYANDTEKKHKDFYQKALDVISASAKETGLAFNWAVCPKCGNTFAEGSIDTNCSFCMTPMDKFLPF